VQLQGFGKRPCLLSQRSRIKFARRHRTRTANKVERDLLDHGLVGSISERQARELAKIENLDELIEIWRIVNELAAV
jgi:hypothetical protein